MHIDDWNEEFLSKIDPEEIVKTIKESGAQMIVAKCRPHTGLANFPTRYGRHHRGLKGRDYVGEMVKLCHENGIEYLLTAHQSDDQIETFLMNLSRGSGLYGLSAMLPESERNGIKILRPMLEVPRSEIKQYCEDNNIKYFVDSMNSDEHYTRVKIRQNRHVLNDDLGISDARILLAVQNLARTREWLDKYIAMRVEMVIRSWGALFLSSFLFDEAEEIRLKFLGTLIQKIGGNDYPVRLNSLQKALSNLQADCKFTLGHCTIRRLNDRILIVPEGKRTSFRKRHEKRKKSI